MRKNIIYATLADSCNQRINFRYRDENGTDSMLFVRKYDKKVYQYFKDGKSIAQLRRDTSWHGRKYLSKIVEDRIPASLRLLEKGGVYAAGTFECFY